MSRIINDLEHGSIILIHDLEGHPSDPESFPAEVINAARQLGDRLGFANVQLDGIKLGWLADLVGHVVESLTAQPAPGHAAAGNQEPPGIVPEAPAAPESAAAAPAGPTAANQEAVAPAAPGAPVEAAAAGEAQAPAEPAAPAADQTAIDAAIANAQAAYGGEQPKPAGS